MTRSPEYTIIVENLTKKFGNFTAVDHINFRVEKGKICGLLGANGAGKSTTIRMLCGLLEPTDGTAIVGGYEIRKEAEKLKSHIGYMSQKFSLYEDITVEENIKFYGGIYGLSKKRISEQMEWIIDMTGLQGLENRITRTLAIGSKQRLALGCALIHQPKIVFLDEPTSGVDPIQRRSFWKLIDELSTAGTTIIVTTHYLDEAEYCNNLLLMDSGRIIATGTPNSIKTDFINFSILEVETDDVISAYQILQNQSWVKKISAFGTYLHIGVEDKVTGIEKIKSNLSRFNINVRRIEEIVPSLEDVFVHLIEQPNQGVEI